MNDDLEFVVDAERRRVFDWKELWSYRELFYFFTWRDIKIKYKQTVLGFAWAVLQPLLMMVIFTVFFGRALNVPSQNLPYPIFVLSGLLLWNLFSSGLTNASASMVNNAQIIKKIYFPRLIIPISSILVAFFDFLITFFLFLSLLLYYKHSVGVQALWAWPLAVLLTTLAAIGPGCLLSALNVKYRDFRYVIPFVVQVLFFVTPVIYPISLLKFPLLRYLVSFSPMYAAVEFFRYPMIGTLAERDLLITSVVSGLLFLAVGLLYFKRTENYFADMA